MIIPKLCIMIILSDTNGGGPPKKSSPDEDGPSFKTSDGEMGRLMVYLLPSGNGI